MRQDVDTISASETSAIRRAAQRCCTIVGLALASGILACGQGNPTNVTHRLIVGGAMADAAPIIDSCLEAASELLAIRDSDTDVACNVRLQRNPDVIPAVPEAVLAPHNLDAMRRVPAYFIAVNAIDTCRGKIGYFLVCTIEDPGVERKTFIVALRDKRMDAVIWAWEYGRSRGIERAASTRVHALMSDKVFPENREVDQNECNQFSMKHLPTAISLDDVPPKLIP